MPFDFSVSHFVCFIAGGLVVIGLLLAYHYFNRERESKTVTVPTPLRGGETFWTTYMAPKKFDSGVYYRVHYVLCNPDDHNLVLLDVPYYDNNSYRDSDHWESLEQAEARCMKWMARIAMGDTQAFASIKLENMTVGVDGKFYSEFARNYASVQKQRQETKDGIQV